MLIIVQWDTLTKHILLMDCEMPNEHLMANIFDISKSEKMRHNAIREDGRTAHRLSVSWFSGEDTGFKAPGQWRTRGGQKNRQEIPEVGWTPLHAAVTQSLKEGVLHRKGIKASGRHTSKKSTCYVHEIKIRHTLRKANKSFIVNKTIFKSLKQCLEETTELVYVHWRMGPASTCRG